MAPERWEAGSEFHWSDDLVGHRVHRDALPPGGAAFASGTGALLTLVRHAGVQVIHVPTYYCIEVVEVLARHVDVRWYRELPDGRGPRFMTLRPRPGEAVLVVNLFGRGDPVPWRWWSCERPDVLVIEDHTHDPWSDWARTSQAPYCVASWRKTLPLPDGAVLWSGQGLPVPGAVGDENPGAVLKLAAMRAKGEWLCGGDVRKGEFRDLQLAGEEALTGCAARPLGVTLDVVGRLDLGDLRARRASNGRLLTDLLSRVPPAARIWAPPRPVLPRVVPFGVQLLCPSRATRDALKRGLVERRIYPAVHWAQEAGGFWSGDDVARTLGDRTLTLPTDHRYGPGDLVRIVAAVEEVGAEIQAGSHDSAPPTPSRRTRHRDSSTDGYYPCPMFSHWGD